jgi:hypothetical protein
MNRRDFLKHVPKTLCASGAAMYVAGKMLDQQPEVLHAPVEPELMIWRHELPSGHSWYDVRETITSLDGTLWQRIWGKDEPYISIVEGERMHRAGTITKRPNGSYEWNLGPIWDDTLNINFRVPDWA